MVFKRHPLKFQHGGKILHRNCNVGVTSTSIKDDLEMFEMWVNKGGITNILYTPQLEADSFHATTDALGDG